MFSMYTYKLIHCGMKYIASHCIGKNKVVCTNKFINCDIKYIGSHKFGKTERNNIITVQFIAYDAY